MRTRLLAISVATTLVTSVGLTLSTEAQAASAAVSPRAAVGAPLNVSAVPGNTGGVVSVTWAAPSSLPSTLLGYTVEGRDGSGTPIPSTRTNAPSTSTGPISISGLADGSSYTFVVYGRYATGDVVSDASASVTPFGLPASPAAPTASRSAPGSVLVSWSEPSSNGGSAITSYTVTCDPACTPVSTSSLSVTVTGLTNTTSYTFQVAATNARGLSKPPSGPSAAVTPYGTPGAPKNVSGTAQNAQLTVTWVAPDSDGGSAITGYTATASPGGKSCTWTTGALSCAITPLANGTTYDVSVTASNLAGKGSETIVKNLKPRTTPSAPTATAVGGNSNATVSWTVPGDGGSPITGYTATSTPGAKVCTGAASATSCTVSGLTNGTSYTFKVTASNEAGTGAESAASNAVVPTAAAPPTKPGQVQNVVAVRAAGSGAASITWQAPDDTGGAPILYYELGFKIGASGTWNAIDDTVLVGTTTKTVTGLTNGSSYFFRVGARNSVDLGNYGVSSEPAIPGTAPGQVTGLTATATSGQVALSWAAPSANGYAIDDYRVEYKLASAGSWTLVDDTSTSTSYTVAGLTNGSQYQFRVKAHNELGDGAYSATVTATPSAASPSPSPSPTTSPSPSPSPTTSPSPSPSPTTSPSPSPTTSPSPSPSPTTSPEIDVPRRVVAERGDRVRLVLDPSERIRAASLRAVIVVNGVRRALEATFRNVGGEIVMTFEADRRPGTYPVLIGQRQQGDFAVLGQTRLVIRKGRRSRP